MRPEQIGDYNQMFGAGKKNYAASQRLLASAGGTAAGIGAISTGFAYIAEFGMPVINVFAAGGFAGAYVLRRLRVGKQKKQMGLETRLLMQTPLYKSL